MRGARKLRLHAQRRQHHVIEHLGLGAANKGRHVQVHHQRLGFTDAVDDIDDFFRDTTVVLLQGADRAIHRIGDAGTGRQTEFGKRGDGVRCKRRDFKPESRIRVGGQHAGTTAVAKQHNAFGRLGGTRRQRLKNQQRVDELIERFGEDATGLPRQRNPGPIIARKRTGVRDRSGKTEFGAAALKQHHWLARFFRAQDFKDAPRIARGFDIHADDFGLRIGEVILKHVTGADVGAIADRHQR